MPYFNSRPLLLAFAAFFGAALSAHAQLVDVLTEAPVTIQATIQSTVTTSTPTSISTALTTVRLTNLQVIQELIDANIITDTTAVGWSLVAVRNAPADLAFVDAGFYLYAIKSGVDPIAIPVNKFSSSVYRSVAKYTEKHQGRYIYSSAGTVTNHVVYNYTPTFTSGTNNKYTLQDSESAGFASVKYVAKDFADAFELFFYGISSISVTTSGGYSGLLTQAPNQGVPNSGLFALTITVGASKLVLADKYGAVSPDVGPGVSQP